MKRVLLLLAAGSLMLSSCVTLIGMQKSNLPEYNLTFDRKDFVFVNYFDYVLPEYIKDKQEVAYKEAVAGFADGLIEGFSNDHTVSVQVANTLAKGYTISNMQSPSYIDSIKTLCKTYNANMLVAIDSLNIWFDWETEAEENEDGSVSKTKYFYLWVRPYVSLYTADGEVIDRCYIDKGMLYKSRPTISGLITIKPSLAKASDEIKSLAIDAGKDFTDKFYPSTEYVSMKFFTGKLFKASINEVNRGNLGHAVDLLTPLTQSSNSNIARKATHNLSMVNEMIENKRNTIQILQNK